MREAFQQLPRLLTGHLQLSLLALLLGGVLSVPLGVLSSRSARVERVAMGFAGVLQTIPSLALLALMVPALAALGLHGIGFLPAFVALVLYSVFPILHGTIVGLRGLDPAVLEAARAVGMDERQQLLQVELPLAMPVIVAGIRTACVWTVGAATLATPVGADSLGNYIFGGLQTRNFSSVLLGCAAAAILALLLDWLGRVVLVAMKAGKRRTLRAALTVFAVLYVYAGASLAFGGSADTEATVIVGAKTFAEQYILSEALALEVSRTTGVRARTRSSLGSSIAFDALRTGAIDIYVDYTGTLWTNVLKRNDKLPREQMRRELDEILAREYGIRVLAALGFENTYALAMRRSVAQRNGVRSLGDLAAASPALGIAGDYEFFARPEWDALVERYGLAFSNVRPMSAALMYQAVTTSAVDVVAGFSTDGRINGSGLLVLEDELGVIPPYEAVVLGSKRLVRQFPEVAACLRALNGKLDVVLMRDLNQQVVDGSSPADAAHRLVEHWHAATPR